MPDPLRYSSSKDFQSGTDWVLPDEGFYTFELTGVREPRTEPNRYKPDEMRTSVALEWTIRGDEDYEGVNFLNFYTFSLHDLATLTKYVKALRGGQPFEEDEDLDLEDLIGKRIQGTIVHRKKEKAVWEEGDPITAETHRPIITSPITIKPKKQRPANPEPLPPILAEDRPRRPAPRPRQPEPEAYVEEFQIPAGYDDDAA